MLPPLLSLRAVARRDARGDRAETVTECLRQNE